MPIPGDAMLYFFGSFFTTSISSAMDFTGWLGCVKNTWGDAARTETGMKLWYGSYGIFLYRLGLTMKLELTNSIV